MVTTAQFPRLDGTGKLPETFMPASVQHAEQVVQAAETLYVNGTASGSESLASVSKQQIIHWLLTGNVTITAMPTNPLPGMVVSLVLIQDGTGGRTVTLPATVKLPYGLDLPVETAGGSVTIWHLWWTGAMWVGGLGYRDVK